MSEKATALIIGGGIAGMEAALKLGQGGYRAVLAEKDHSLGGTVSKLCSSFPRWEDPQDLLRLKEQQLQSLETISILRDTEITGIEKKKGTFHATWKNSSGEEGALNAQAVIVATGFDLFDASIYGEYGYGIYPGVVNSLEFEQVLKDHTDGKAALPRNIAFFKCVGSRDRSKGHPYCSKICCMYTAKQAGTAKNLSPESKCYVFYMDYRAAGKEYEEFVRSVIEEKQVRYVRGRPSKVVMEKGQLLVRFEDTLIGAPMEVAVDMVVLASAVIPKPATRRLAEMLGLKTDEYGFIEAEYGSAVKAQENIFFAGGCGFAVETIGASAQGAAAAAEVMALFNKGGKP
ncbi:MAG: FAD-dependent oxidoreductase [Desulfovibrionaceae bacterium]|nr:FAD-dependent oxidoreductase [Desulfovibrionaceae bacterium]